jgi:hypothetical protein
VEVVSVMSVEQLALHPGSKDSEGEMVTTEGFAFLTVIFDMQNCQVL